MWGEGCVHEQCFVFSFLFFLRESLSIQLHSQLESRRACDLLELESHLCEPLDTGDNQTPVPCNSTMCSKPLNDFSRPS